MDVNAPDDRDGVDRTDDRTDIDRDHDRDRAVPIAGLDLDDAVADAPSSAKLVYLLLRESGPARPREIADDLSMHHRTVYESLRMLREKEIVKHYPDPRDARRSFYEIS